jgi:hypothetical protein
MLIVLGGAVLVGARLVARWWTRRWSDVLVPCCADVTEFGTHPDGAANHTPSPGEWYQQ